MADDTDLVAVLLEIERHVGRGGWDQSPRLFALVSTERLMAAETGLAERLRGSGPTAAASEFADGDGAGGGSAGEDGEDSAREPAEAFTAVEQDDFAAGLDLVDDLARIAWPEAVDGCAVAVERTFLPAGLDVDLPDDAEAASAAVAAHPQRQEIRVVVGVDRRGRRHGVARVRSEPNELLGGADLVPGLAEVLAHTLT